MDCGFYWYQDLFCLPDPTL